MVWSWCRDRYGIVVIPSCAACFTVLFGFTGRLRGIPVWPYTCASRTAAGSVWRHLGGALIGVACYQLFGDSLWVYVLAQILVLWYMLLTRTVHPPAGANPIIMIYSGCTLSALWHPVFLGVLSLGHGGCNMESTVSRPLALSTRLVRPLSPVLVLGRLE